MFVMITASKGILNNNGLDYLIHLIPRFVYRYEMELENLRQEMSNLMDYNGAIAEELKQEKKR